MKMNFGLIQAGGFLSFKYLVDSVEGLKNVFLEGFLNKHLACIE